MALNSLGSTAVFRHARTIVHMFCASRTRSEGLLSLAMHVGRRLGVAVL